MKKKFLKAAFDTQVWKLFQPLGKNRLLVLNYHRINTALEDGFSDFVPNVSATPNLFESQMDYLLSNGFNFISQNDLIAWLYDGSALPPYAVMVTFDDGYEDNYSQAYPILKQRNIPATIFLSTDYIGSSQPFYWDLVAYCLFHSPMKSIRLPLLGKRQWKDREQMNNVSDELVRSLKSLPEGEKKEILLTIPEILEVEVNHTDFARKHLSWDQAREMAGGLITFGGHTKSHPILTQINLESVKQELVESKQKIEKEIGVPVEALAYPNGESNDFSPEIMEMVNEVGYKIAFSLINGHTQYQDLYRMRYELRRIYLGRSDVLPRFAVKINPISMWINLQRR